MSLAATILHTLCEIWAGLNVGFTATLIVGLLLLQRRFAQARRVVQANAQRDDGRWPAIAILRPCEGAEPGLHENLLSSVTAPYPGPRQVLILVPSERDAAHAIAQDVVRAAAALPPSSSPASSATSSSASSPASSPASSAASSTVVRVLVTSPPALCNRKAFQLAAAMPQVQAPIVVCGDSDVRLSGDDLPALLWPFREGTGPRPTGASFAAPIEVASQTAWDRAGAALVCASAQSFLALYGLYALRAPRETDNLNADEDVPRSTSAEASAETSAAAARSAVASTATSAVASAFAPSAQHAPRADAAHAAPMMAGALCALPTAALDQIGGFSAFFDCLGEDNEIARRLCALGYHIAVSPLPARCFDGGRTARQVIDRAARWQTVVRAQRPALWPTYPLMLGVTPALVLLALLWPSKVLTGFVLTLVVLRTILSQRLLQLQGLPASLFQAVVALVQGEGLLWLGFLRSAASRRITWRGHPFRVERGGHLRPVPQRG